MAGSIKQLELSLGVDVGSAEDLTIETSTTFISPYDDDAAFVADNGPAEAGSLYFNTSIGALRYFNGSIWGDVSATVEFDDLAPTSDKGDLIVHDGTNNIALGAGADGTLLSADSTQTTGYAWVSALVNPMDAEGQIIIGGTAGAATKLIKGNALEVLRVNSAGTTLEYGPVAGKGSFPIGGIVAVASSIAGAHTIPASGTVDAAGFQLCDGAAIPSGQVLTGSTPNLSDGLFLRGAVTSGSTGGADSASVTLVAGNIPQLSGSFTTSNPDSTGNSLATHTHNYIDSEVFNDVLATVSAGPDFVGKNAVTKTSFGPNNVDHTHTVNVNLGSSSPTSFTVNTLPKYFNVQYLIRVI